MRPCFNCHHPWIEHLLGLSCIHVGGCEKRCRKYVAPPKYKPPKNQNTRPLGGQGGSEGDDGWYQE